MIIREMQKGPHVLYSLAGTTLSIGGISIDLAAEQEDAQNIIDICANEKGEIVRGMNRAYAANILIPPAEYTQTATGETDEKGNAVYTLEKKPLDVGRVELVLWKYEKPAAESAEIEEE
ncbi:MAG: hypothetical protein Q4D58_07965 [Synergistaceae bacterium]|nr:hypothetical protein [Synergistaceae bacterium]